MYALDTIEHLWQSRTKVPRTQIENLIVRV